MGLAGRVPTTAGGLSAIAAHAALAPGLWEQIWGLEWPSEPPTPSIPFSLQDACKGSWHPPPSPWPGLGCKGCAGVQCWSRRQRSCTQGGCGEQCSGLHPASSYVPALLPSGRAAKGLSWLRVAAGGVLQTWPGKRARHEARDKAWDVCGAAWGSSSSWQREPHSRQFGSQPIPCLARLCSSGRGKPGSEGKGQDHTNQSLLVWEGAVSTKCTSPRAWAWVQPGIPHHPPCSTPS